MIFEAIFYNVTVIVCNLRRHEAQECMKVIGTGDFVYIRELNFALKTKTYIKFKHDYSCHNLKFCNFIRMVENIH